MTSEPARERRRELPDVVWGAWLIAGAVLLWLTVSVVRHLSAAPSGEHHHSASTALFRAGADEITSPLLGWPLLTHWQLDAVAVALAAVTFIPATSKLGLAVKKLARFNVSPS